MRPVLDAAARFAPATTVAIADGHVVLHLFALPPFEVGKLNLRMITDAKGVALDASATGTYWDRVAIEGRVEFDDLRARMKLEGSGLRPQPALEAMFADVRGFLALSELGAQLEARTDGHTDIDIVLGLDLPDLAIRRGGKQVDISHVRLGGSLTFIEDNIAIVLDQLHLGDLAPAAKVSLRLSGAQRAPALDCTVGELDLSALGAAALTLAADQPVVKEYVSRIRGGQLRDLRFSTQAGSFAELFALSRLHGSADLADASLLVPSIEREATGITAHAELAGGALKVSGLSARLGASRLRQAGVDLVLLKPMRLERTRGQATLVLQDLLPGLRARAPFAKLLRSLPPLAGVAETTVRNLALRFDRPGQVTYDLSVAPRHLRIQTDKLPGALELNGGAVRVAPESLSVERVGIELLDSKASVSGELTGFKDKHLRAAGRVADGVVEKKLLDWIWQRSALPERLKPVTPLHFSASRVQWSETGLDVVAEANINAGPSLGVDLSTRDNTFTLRRATIKDRDSDATVSFAMRDSLVQVSFAGVLAARSLARILGRPAENYPGSLRGDIRATLDLTRRGRSAARGSLAGERIDLTPFTGAPLKLERFELQGAGEGLQLHEVTLDWAQQKATIRGELARAGSEVAATLQIDSPGIIIDALRGASTAKAASTSADEQDRAGKSFDPWSLPLRGAVSLRTDFVEYHGYRVQGIRARATLQHDAAALEVTEASLCGIALAPSLRITPTQFDARLSLTAKNQSLERVVQCLGSNQVSITGNFTMSGVLSTQGSRQQVRESWAEHLAGSVEFSAQDGEIRKMALLGNILSLKSVNDLLKGDVGLGEHGFRYRSIAVGGTIEKGTMTLDRTVLDSPALGLAATGTLSLQSYQSRLTVLVAPFGKLDRMVRKIPILGYVIGGAFTSVPVGVSGDIRKPVVVPLGPRAVGSEVLGVFERSFKLPGKMVEPLSGK
jgi:hypothetical protein